MKSIIYHPGFILAVLGAISGKLGTYALDVSVGEAPQLGLYMMLTGLWFGFVVAFGVWQWGNRSWVAIVTALVATWIAWEVAVNFCLQLTENWLKAVKFPAEARTYVGGFAAGAVGAFVTWAGVAASTPSLRQTWMAAAMVVTGAIFGLLLPWTNEYDSPAILLLPWQSAVAVVLGVCLDHCRRHDTERPFAATGKGGSTSTFSL